jgi:hypothetical protein
MNANNSDMLLETLIQRTIAEESAITMSALLAAPIPEGMIRYIRTEIANRLAEDLTFAPHFARIAPPTAGPDTLRNALLAYAAGQYIFPRDEFLEILENAARFTENYLCRPRWTLSSFLFLNQPAVATEMLIQKLEYLADYAYLPQLLRRMVTQGRKQVISSSECISYIARIDDVVLREHSPREQALLAKPIFRFFLLSSDIENKPITLRPLLLFLEDKQLTSLRDYVEGVWHVRGKTEITIEEFIALHEDFATGRSSFALPPTIEGPPPEPTGRPTAEEEKPIDVAPPVETPFPEEPAAELQAQEIVMPPGPVQESLQFVDPLPANPLPPAAQRLEEMIPSDMRRRFVQVICGRDAEFYDLVIARLDEMQSWQQAAAYVRELFEINNIDPFDATAIAFTDIVQQRCKQCEMGQ